MDPVPQGAPSLQELPSLPLQGGQRPGATRQGCGAASQGSFRAKMLLELLLLAGWRSHRRAQLYWDFQLLDSDGDGRLPVCDAELLLREVLGTSASGQAWHSFLREHRHGLAWQDIEAWLSAAPQPQPESAWAPGQGRRVDPETGCPGGTGAGTDSSSVLRPWAMHRPWQLLDGIWASEPGQVASWQEVLAGPRLVTWQRVVPSRAGREEDLWGRAAQAASSNPTGPDPAVARPSSHWTQSLTHGGPPWHSVGKGVAAQGGAGASCVQPQEMPCTKPGALPAWELPQRETGALQPYERSRPEAFGPPQRGQRLLSAQNKLHTLQPQGAPKTVPETQERGELETWQPRGSPLTALRGLQREPEALEHPGQRVPGAHQLQGAPQAELAAHEPQDPQALEAHDQGEPRAQEPQGHPHGEQGPQGRLHGKQGLQEHPHGVQEPQGCPHGDQGPQRCPPREQEPQGCPHGEQGPQRCPPREQEPQGHPHREQGPLQAQGTPQGDPAAFEPLEHREPLVLQPRQLVGLDPPESPQRQLETRQAPGRLQREPGAPESLRVPRPQEVLLREPQGQQALRAHWIRGALHSELSAPQGLEPQRWREAQASQLHLEPEAPAPQEVRGPPEPLQPQGSLQMEQGWPQEGREPSGPMHQGPRVAEPLLPWDTPQSEPELWGSRGAQPMEPSGAPQPQGAVLRDPPRVHTQGPKALRPALLLGPGSVQAPGTLHGEELLVPQLQPMLQGLATQLELGLLQAQGRLQGDPKVIWFRELDRPQVPQLHETPLGPLQPRDSVKLQELKGQGVPQVSQLKRWGPGAYQPQGARLREAFGPRELGGPQVPLQQALIGPEMAQPWGAPLLEMKPAQCRVLEPLKPETEEPRVSLQQEPETEEPRVSPQQEPETEEPRVSPQQETETEEPWVSPQREPETEEPRVSLEREAETEEPRVSLQWEPETEEPRGSLQREPETEEPRLSPQREPETEEPRVSPQREPEALEPLERREQAAQEARGPVTLQLRDTSWRDPAALPPCGVLPREPGAAEPVEVKEPEVTEPLEEQEGVEIQGPAPVALEPWQGQGTLQRELVACGPQELRAQQAHHGNQGVFQPQEPVQWGGEVLPAQDAAQRKPQAHQLLEPAEATGPSPPSPGHPGQSPWGAPAWDQAALGAGGSGVSPAHHGERGGEAMGPCWRHSPAPPCLEPPDPRGTDLGAECGELPAEPALETGGPSLPAPWGRPWGSPLCREKAFIRPSRREQQEAVRRLAELQLEGGRKHQRDKERQLLQFQERLSIARHRSVETLPGRSQPPAEPQLQEARAQQREALKQHLEQVKRERTHGLQARRHRNTLSFQELLKPLVAPGEDGSNLSRAGQA